MTAPCTANRIRSAASPLLPTILSCQLGPATSNKYVRELLPPCGGLMFRIVIRRLYLSTSPKQLEGNPTPLRSVKPIRANITIIDGYTTTRNPRLSVRGNNIRLSGVPILQMLSAQLVEEQSRSRSRTSRNAAGQLQSSSLRGWDSGVQLEERKNMTNKGVVSKAVSRVAVRVIHTDGEVMITHMVCRVLGLRCETGTDPRR
jgi:hypothetical protein